jgi:hypothetical protein
MAVDPTDLSALETELQFDGGHAIAVPATTVAAFLGRAQRGPLNEAIAVESFEAYRRIFGGHSGVGFLSQAVQQYFQHGGREAVVVRIANRAVRASLELEGDGGILRLQAREPGAYEFLRASVDYDGIPTNEERFNLVVQRLTRPGSQLVEDQELFSALSMDERDHRFVVDVLKQSELIRLSGPLPAERPRATRASHPGQPIPYVDMSWGGSDGEELTDYDIIGSNEEGTGLFALESVENIDLLCIPSLASGREIGITTFLAAERYCRKRHAMLIWDPPWSWRSAESALMGIRNSNVASRNAMMYFPRIRSRDAGERYADGIPACGAVAGILARNDRVGVWQSLEAGDSQLKFGLSPVSEIGQRQAAMLKRQGINSITRTDLGTYRLAGDVSLAGSKAVSRLWQRLDRRRLAFFILSSTRRHTRWALGRTGDQERLTSLTRQINEFLNALFERGALAGDRPAQAFFVRISASTEEQDETRLRIRIGFALEKPNEFQIYDIVHRTEGTECRAVPPLDAAQLAG